MEYIDLRSDTVTMPTAEMRTAMYRAEVGDDVYSEDPTVKALEEFGAQITGKEAGLFVASGTMGNQIAVMVHANRGDEIICESESHVYYYEVGGLAYLAGTQARTIKGVNGILQAADIEKAVRGDDIHQPRTALMCLENTHNRAGGTFYTPSDLAAISAVSKRHSIPIHIDGARIFNAAVAQNLTVDKLACYADSMSFCLSKGLCAPVGSILVGSKKFISKARRMRKMLGGGMRQAGIIAAAGIVALESMVERLAEDHFHANKLGKDIADMGLAIDMSTVLTNIILFDVESTGKTADKFALLMEERGVKCSQFGEYKIRLVTHHGISMSDIDYVSGVISKIISDC